MYDVGNIMRVALSGDGLMREDTCILYILLNHLFILYKCMYTYISYFHHYISYTTNFLILGQDKKILYNNITSQS